MIVETKRTVIRPFTAKDGDDLFEILGDEETMRHLESPYDMDKTIKFLNDFCIMKKGALAVENKENGKMIGYILFKEYECEVYEMGWIFNKNYWNKGYAYESCYAIIAYAFSTMEIHKIIAETTDSIKSAGLMRKLGMTLEGTLRKQTRDSQGCWSDMLLYGILRDEFHC